MYRKKDTASYYARILGQVVRSPESLHAWTKNVTGICIDAWGVTMAKDNPKVTFEYEQGFTSQQ